MLGVSQGLLIVSIARNDQWTRLAGFAIVAASGLMFASVSIALLVRNYKGIRDGRPL